MLDLGANTDRTTEMLVEFSYLGDALCRAVKGLDKPSIGLLNIGEEQLKGSEEIKEAASKLEQSPLNFCGNVEANSLYNKVVDVVVCDGFTGNVVLKNMEGIAGMIRGMMIDAYTSSNVC